MSPRGLSRPVNPKAQPQRRAPPRCRIETKEGARLKTKTIIKILTAAGALSALGAAALWPNPVVRRYKLKAEPEGLRILLVSDLHGYLHDESQSAIIGMAADERPDIILLAGDMVDYQVGFDGTGLFLEGIRDIAPVFYVTGNHEYYGGNAEAIKNRVAAYGVTVLSDEHREIEIKGHRLIIAGVEDPKRENIGEGYNQIQSMKEAFSDLKADDGIYKILLSHRPERFASYLKYPFDLIVSGHTHGGQVRIPFLVNGLYAPNQGFFPRYAGGLYRHGETTHIVTRGVGIWPQVPRVFNPPEICLIKFEGEKKEAGERIRLVK